MMHGDENVGGGDNVDVAWWQWWFMMLW